MTIRSPGHAHLWHTESTQRTLEGPLRYQHCSCGQWRISVTYGLDDEEIVRTRLGPPRSLGDGGITSEADPTSIPSAHDSAGVVAAIATTLILWSSAFVAIRVAADEFSSPGLTLGRLLVASLALAAVTPMVKVRVPARADAFRLTICALTGMAGYQFFLNSGERTVDAGTANLLVNTSPVLTAVFAWVLLANRPSRRIWTGIGLAFTGASVLALAQGDGVQLSRGALLVLVAALCQATFFVVETPVLRRYTGFEVTCYATWIATIAVLPAAGHLVSGVPSASSTALG